MKRSFHAVFSLVLLLTAAPWLESAAASGQHRRLEVQNRFETADAALEYFLGRDASGFVWSGYLESEREEFTVWKSGPAQDGFYVASGFTVRQEDHPKSPDQKAFLVRYDLESVRDSAGTLSPTPERTRTVRFVMRKINGRWKVAEPGEGRFMSVLVSSHIRRDFPSR